MRDRASFIKQALEVETVCVFLNNINFAFCLDRVIVAYAVVTVKHLVYLHLSYHHLHTLFFEEFVVLHFARKDWLRIIYARFELAMISVERTGCRAQQIGSKLCFYYGPELAFTDNLVVKD